MAIQTWADGFGLWHASVPLTDNWRKDAATARAAILAELLARAPRGTRARDIRFSVTRTDVTLHGTARYATSGSAHYSEIEV